MYTARSFCDPPRSLSLCIVCCTYSSKHQSTRRKLSHSCLVSIPAHVPYGATKLRCLSPHSSRPSPPDCILPTPPPYSIICGIRRPEYSVTVSMVEVRLYQANRRSSLASQPTELASRRSLCTPIGAPPYICQTPHVTRRRHLSRIAAAMPPE
jgi:hypothetical protein